MTHNLKPAQPVLVRDEHDKKWKLDIFSYFLEPEQESTRFPFVCLTSAWRFCIPLEGNEHLINTTIDPDKPFEPEHGKVIAVSDSKRKHWRPAIFHEKTKKGYLCKAWNDPQAIPEIWAVAEPFSAHFEAGN